MSRLIRSFLLLTFLTTLFATPALAGNRSKLTITVDRPIAVLVDGAMLEYEEGTTSVEVIGIEPGKHLVEFRNFGGKLVGEGEVRVPTEGPAIVRARWAGKKFEVYDTVLLEPERDHVVVEHHTTVVEPAGEHVSVSASMGGMGVSASVSVSGSHSTVVHEDVIVENVQRGTRLVTFRVTDDESVNVFIDGKKVWAYHVGTTEKKVEVAAGEHHIDLKDFMEDETLCQGQLYVDQDLVIGISQRGCLEVYTDPGAFSRR
jgi:hypothetical protein